MAKRNAQDATRRYDVRPLRKRIEKLEVAMRQMQRALVKLNRAAR